MANQTARARTPNTVNFTVGRRYLTEREVERLMDTARKLNRHGHRDSTMILTAYRHGMRASECFKLANDGHDTRSLQHYLGHKNIQHTVRYTEMSPDRFKDFWR